MNQGGELVIALIFSELDTNQDGFINKDEARDFIMKSNNSSDAKDTALKLIDPIFELLDTDKDGKISVQELITAFSKNELP
jgi:Ca2+-binding EF-hand superfamily protein